MVVQKEKEEIERDERKRKKKIVNIYSEGTGNG